MTDIEQKALALVNEVAGDCCHEMDDARFNEVCSALYLSIEQHEAFRQEVSDALLRYYALSHVPHGLQAFIIAKPDPLVEALEEASGTNDPVEWANRFYAAIEKRGGKIVWREEQ